MKRAGKKFNIAFHLLTAAVLPLLFSFSACIKHGENFPTDIPQNISPVPTASQASETVLPAETPSPTPLPGFTPPILSFEGQFKLNGCAVTYPCFVGPNTARLNKALYSAFAEYASHMEKPCQINYRLAFCKRGIISVWLIASKNASDKTALPEEFDRASFNYDVFSGRTLAISDCFGCEYTAAYAEALASMLASRAQENSITLISNIKPVPENQSFIFDNGGLIFYYHLYEIASFKDGTPMLILSFDDLKSLPSTPESAVGRFCSGK